MKRPIAIVLIAAASVSSLAGCGQKTPDDAIYPFPVLGDGSVLSMNVDTCVSINAESDYLKEAKKYEYRRCSETTG